MYRRRLTGRRFVPKTSRFNVSKCLIIQKVPQVKRRAKSNGKRRASVGFLVSFKSVHSSRHSLLRIKNCTCLENVLCPEMFKLYKVFFEMAVGV